jgi:hypothetical protein
MTFSLQFELDYHRVISAVINDSRSVIPSLVGQDGNAVYEYAQGLIGQVTAGVLVYRVKTDQGNLSGFCAIQVKNGATSLLFYQLRPACIQFEAEILGIISIFIAGNYPLNDILY